MDLNDNSYLNKVAQYLATEDLKKKRGAAPPSTALDRVYTHRPGGIEATIFSKDGMGRAEYDDTAKQQLDEIGYRWLPNDDYDRMRQEWNPLRDAPPKGKLPFISETPTHQVAAGAVPMQGDPGMTDAMAGAAEASRSMAGKTVSPPSPAPPPEQKKPTSAKKGTREIQVSMTSSSGVQPELRDFQPLAPMAPRQSLDQRLQGLPEGVAQHMRSRLEVAQEDANKRSMAVEIASALNQMGNGIAGAQYHDGAWDSQRKAAHQPVADAQALTADERAQQQIQHQHNMDERTLQQAMQHADMEERKFKYQQGHDAIEDQLKREGFAKDVEIAKQRLKGEEYSRWLQHQDLLLRARQAQTDREKLQEDKQAAQKERQGEKDLQSLGQATSRAPFGEFQKALEDVDALVPGLAYGKAPAENPLSVKDRLARAVPLGAGEWAMSDEGKKYATAITNLRDLISRMRSGAVLNSGEEQHYKSLIGDEVLSDPAKAAAGINAVRQGMAQKLRNTQAPYAKTGALDKYEATGATTYRAPVFAGKPAPVVMMSPDGKQYEVDAEEVAEATHNGWKVR